LTFKYNLFIILPVGFNKRYITKKSSLTALHDNRLILYYGRADVMIFEDDLSEIIYDLYLSGKTEQEILNIINLNTEKEIDEVH
jgi:hypothetical protein